MSSETLENEKPQDEEEAQAQAEDNHTNEEKEEAEKNDVDEKGEEDRDQVEEEKNEEDEDGDNEEEEETEEREKVKSNKSMKESGSATPTSERPTRERKTVDRYTVSSPDKFPRSSSFKALEIEKGNGTPLKDIPNVAFKLSKRKPDDNLRALHGILFAKKAKAHNLKRNIGLFSGFVWTENEEKQRAKIRERIDKCVKEKLVDFCNVLNIPINKASMKKEDLSAKLLEFLEFPHATTDVLLADKEKKGKKRTRKLAGRKSVEGSEKPAKKQKKTSQLGKRQKQSSDIEDSDTAEHSDAEVDSQEDDVLVPKGESDHEESKSESEEDEQKAHKRTSKKAVKEDQTTPVKKVTDAKTAKSNDKTPKKSSSKKAAIDSTKQSASKKQKTAEESQNSKGKVANKKQTEKSPKALAKDQGKGKSTEKGKAEPSRNEIHQVVVDILKEVDFNKATLSDILKQLGNHFDLDLMPRKAEVKDIITDVINSMSDDDGEEPENVGHDDADEDEA